MLKRLFCCAAALGLFLPMATLAEEVIPPSPIVKTALLVHAPGVKKGEVFWAGVTFTIPKDWHIYWQNPGDSGIPTTLAWTLPSGLSVGDTAWPVPERIDTSGIINYGYSNQVTLAVPITPSQDRVTGKIAVKANWLVCHETCIPESAMLTATIEPNPSAGALLEAARRSQPAAFTGTNVYYHASGKDVLLQIPTETMGGEAIVGASFFPAEDGVISNSAPQHAAFDAAHHMLTITTVKGEASAPASWHGVVLVHTKSVTRAYNIEAKRGAPVAQQSKAEPPPSDAPDTEVSGGAAMAGAAPFANPPTSLVVALILAFGGGLILNVMPCVLPILALKALAIAKKARVARKSAAHQGMAYTAGVIISFLMIAGLMFVLKASGAAIGWGFQLQNTGFVAALLLVMLLVSANLLGMFSLPVLFGRHAHEVNENSLLGSFLTGVLAVMVATPCTAPFMATAIGATLTFPTMDALLVFASLGLGMASPFLVISLWPAALRLLPKPGAWMIRFKQLLAIPMLATAAWLAWVLVEMHGGPMQANATREMYSAARLQELRDAGTPVFVDATAAWCLSCKVNERVALRPEAMQQFLREHHVVMMVADWTNSDPAITAYLASFGRNGVPLYVYYPPHGTPVVLPQILTPALVRQAVDGAHE